mmetsp:Transcript_2747/g.3918  ORF Transcript_2747/g.3918 Transcript_2747/m.3918 type:complete len:437 (+) Transcript_2747:169-1479(+)
MYWSKVIIASLVASPSFARRQRLGRPALLDNVEMVGDGVGFDEPPSTQFSSRTLEIDQQDGADAYALELDEDGSQFPQADEDGFFDLAPHLDPDFLSLLSDEDQSALFGYTGEDVDQQVARHLGLTGNHCKNNKKPFLLKIKADSENPGDNIFKIFFNDRQVMKRGPFGQAVESYAGICVPAGKLQVEATDESGDGMKDGSYEIELEGVVVARSPGSDSWSRRVHTFDTSSNTATTGAPTSSPSPKPTPAPNTVISGRNTCFEPRTEEEADYLSEHNERRATYHSIHEAVYKPLQWSNELADSSAAYATELLQYCCTQELPHDPTNGGSYGENLASNCGSGSWGAKPPAEQILSRWVDNEHGLSRYVNKRHYTQVLWRGTDHVGCGVAERDMGNGKTCHMQVCRYQKPGNCGANNWNYLEKMLADSSRCAGVDVDC